jgi:hypothetical protein
MPGVKRKISKEKGRPVWRLPPIGQPRLRCLNSGIHTLAMGGKSVRRGRALRHGILPWRKGIGIHAYARCAAVDPDSPPRRSPGYLGVNCMASIQPFAHLSRQRRLARCMRPGCRSAKLCTSWGRVSRDKLLGRHSIASLRNQLGSTSG